MNTSSCQNEQQLVYDLFGIALNLLISVLNGCLNVLCAYIFSKKYFTKNITFKYIKLQSIVDSLYSLLTIGIPIIVTCNCVCLISQENTIKFNIWFLLILLCRFLKSLSNLLRITVLVHRYSTLANYKIAKMKSINVYLILSFVLLSLLLHLPKFILRIMHVTQFKRRTLAWSRNIQTTKDFRLTIILLMEIISISVSLLFILTFTILLILKIRFKKKLRNEIKIAFSKILNDSTENSMRCDSIDEPSSTVTPSPINKRAYSCSVELTSKKDSVTTRLRTKSYSSEPSKYEFNIKNRLSFKQLLIKESKITIMIIWLSALFILSQIFSLILYIMNRYVDFYSLKYNSALLIMIFIDSLLNSFNIVLYYICNQNFRKCIRQIKCFKFVLNK